MLERWKNINEYLAIDISNEMNELCENILKHRPKKFKKAFYRQYLPISNVSVTGIFLNIQHCSSFNHSDD